MQALYSTDVNRNRAQGARPGLSLDRPVAVLIVQLARARRKTCSLLRERTFAVDLGSTEATLGGEHSAIVGHRHRQTRSSDVSATFVGGGGM